MRGDVNKARIVPVMSSKATPGIVGHRGVRGSEREYEGVRG